MKNKETHYVKQVLSLLGCLVWPFDPWSKFGWPTCIYLSWLQCKGFKRTLESISSTKNEESKQVNTQIHSLTTSSLMAHLNDILRSHSHHMQTVMFAWAVPQTILFRQTQVQFAGAHLSSENNVHIIKPNPDAQKKSASVKSLLVCIYTPRYDA